MRKAELSKEMFEFLVNSHVIATPEMIKREIKNRMDKAVTIQDLKTILEETIVTINLEIKAGEYRLELATIL